MKKPKVLIFDIENSPNVSYTWGKYEQDVIAFEREWYMLSYAYKWHGEKTVKCKGLVDYPNFKKDKHDDSALVADLWNLFDEADIIIAHNGDRFDIRKSNARFLAHSLGVPSTYKTIDTLKIARKHFMLNSNKLGDIGKLLGIGQKEDTGGFGLWLECMAGDRKAWKKMKSYNTQDVVLLEKVYEELRKWHTNHPNFNAISGTGDKCPTCGGEHLHKRGFRVTKTQKYQRLQCQDCGSWCDGENITKTKIERK